MACLIAGRPLMLRTSASLKRGVKGSGFELIPITAMMDGLEKVKLSERLRRSYVNSSLDTRTDGRLDGRRYKLGEDGRVGGK